MLYTVPLSPLPPPSPSVSASPISLFVSPPAPPLPLSLPLSRQQTLFVYLRNSVPLHSILPAINRQEIVHPYTKVCQC